MYPKYKIRELDQGKSYIGLFGFQTNQMYIDQLNQSLSILNYTDSSECLLMNNIIHKSVAIQE